MHLTVAVQDRSLAAYADRLKRLGAEGRLTLSTVLNAAGAEVRLLTVKAEAEQAGLPERTVDKAQRAVPATASTLTYRLRAEGGNIRLKFFGAQETEGGVVARPLGQARTFAHAFMKGGSFPNRVPLGSLNGGVFQRKGRGRLPIEAVRSGVFLPNEMVTGRTVDVFREGVATIVATTVVRRLGALV